MRRARSARIHRITDLIENQIGFGRLDVVARGVAREGPAWTVAACSEPLLTV